MNEATRSSGRLGVPHWLSSSVSWFLRLSWSAKLVVTAISSATAGGLAAAVSEYAAYRFALFYGVRPPVEGIPYLKITVAGLTVITLVGGAFLLLLLLVAGAAIERALQPLSSSRRQHAGQQRPAGARFTRAVFVFVVLQVLVVCVGLAGAARVREGSSGSAIMMFLGTLAVGNVVVYAQVRGWWSRLVRWTAVASTVGLIAVLLVAPFFVDVYGLLMRTLGYGGGMAVCIETDGSMEDSHGIGGYLVLRTTSALVVYQPAARSVREIQIGDVRSLAYSAKPLFALESCLPNHFDESSACSDGGLLAWLPCFAPRHPAQLEVECSTLASSSAGRGDPVGDAVEGLEAPPARAQ